MQRYVGMDASVFRRVFGKKVDLETGKIEDLDTKAAESASEPAPKKE